jgi:hypothetical protein
MKMFSLWDSKAEAYSNPQYFRTEGEAIRSAAKAANAEGEIGENPGDFVLFEVGSFDWSSGVVEGCPPRQIVCLIELVESSTPELR